MKVLAASIIHESHSFSVLPTGITEFAQDKLLRGDDIAKALRNTRTEWGGIFDAADAFGWTLIHPLAARASPAGPVTAEAYEMFAAIILGAAAQAAPLDGILLSLHGSMAAANAPDAEGDLLRRLRSVVGPALPIAVTLDLHANVTVAMIDHADIITSYRTTPHVDMHETARRAADLLRRTMAGEIKPVPHLARRATLVGMDLGRTIGGKGPMVDLLARAATLAKTTPGVLDISLMPGFYYADLPEAGPSALVIGDGKDQRFQDVAEMLMDEVWKSRDGLTIDLKPVPEAVGIAAKPRDKAGPLIIADYTDGPGGGGYADNTVLLSALIEAGIDDVVVGHIADPAVAAIGVAAGVGAALTVEVGGKVDPRFSGNPLRLTGRVGAVSDGDYIRKGPFTTGTRGQLGPSFRLDLDRAKILICTNRVQTEDREQFRILGVDPEDVNVIACKGINHFRADFEPIARQILFVDSGGICTLDLTRFPYRRVRRPIWPLDREAFGVVMGR